MLEGVWLTFQLEIAIPPDIGGDVVGFRFTGSVDNVWFIAEDEWANAILELSVKEVIKGFESIKGFRIIFGDEGLKESLPRKIFLDHS
jgi:hypothetical protein